MVPTLFRWLPAIVLCLPLQAAIAATPGNEASFFPITVDIAGGVGDRANAVAVQRDGKILLTGSVNLDEGQQVAIARLLPDGSPDIGFGDNGQRRVGFGPATQSAGGWIGEMPDGRILVVGTVINGNTPAASIVVMRLLADGEFDATFSIDGRAQFGDDINAVCGLAFSSETIASGCEVVLQPDGNLLVAGNALQSGPARGIASQFGTVLLYRIRPDAMPDPTFGTGGRRLITTLPNDPDVFFGGYGLGMLLRDGGRILLASSVVSQGSQSQPGLGLLQLRPDGTADTAFADGGASVIEAATGDGFFPIGMQLSRDGRIHVGAHAALSGIPAFVVARFLPDGTPDPGFGSGGISGTSFDLSGNAQSYDAPTALHLDSTGRAYVVGYAEMPDINGEDNYDMAVARFTRQGLPDTGFGPGGRRTYGFDISFGGGPLNVLRERAFDAAVDKRGRLILAGGSDAAGDNDFMMVRLLYTHDMFRDDFDGPAPPSGR